RAPPGPARPPDPAHDRRPGARRDQLLARPLPRRRGKGDGRLPGAQAAPRRRRRRMHPVRGHAPRPRQRRRDRAQGARPVHGHPDGPRPMTLTILEGSTFCICDDLGDIDRRTHGFYSEDTRFLSVLRLRINDARPLLLSSGKVEYFSAAFFLRNPLAGGLEQDVVSILRERFVGESMQDVIVAQNQSMEQQSLELELEIEADFVVPRQLERRFGDEMTRVRDSLAAWRLRVPQIRADWDDLGRSFFQSVSDLASLRMQRGGRIGRLPAAGMPWFMTVFGRDTLITCYQTLLFGPELARSGLEVLAELQATEDDPTIDAEPGKIVHEV